jgi:hypothetical protein
LNYAKVNQRNRIKQGIVDGVVWSNFDFDFNLSYFSNAAEFSTRPEIKMRWILLILFVSIIMGCDNKNLVIKKDNCYQDSVSNSILKNASKTEIFTFHRGDTLNLGMTLDEFAVLSSPYFERIPSNDSSQVRCHNNKLFSYKKDWLACQGDTLRVLENLFFYDRRLFEYDLIVYGTDKIKYVQALNNCITDKVPLNYKSIFSLGEDVDLKLKKKNLKMRFILTDTDNEGNQTIPRVNLKISWSN